MESYELSWIPEGKQISKKEIPEVLHAIRKQSKQGGMLAAAYLLHKHLS